MGLELPVLFASRLGQIAGIVFRSHDDDEAAARFVRAQIETERRVPALVTPCLESVDPYGRAIVDRAKMQECMDAALHRTQVDRASIPTCAEVAGVADSARPRFRC